MALESMEVSDRGFKHGEEILDQHGGTIRAYESSAYEPHIWVNTETASIYSNEKGEGTVHLSIEAAAALRDQLVYLVSNHFLNDNEPSTSETPLVQIAKIIELNGCYEDSSSTLETISEILEANGFKFSE